MPNVVVIYILIGVKVMKNTVGWIKFSAMALGLLMASSAVCEDLMGFGFEDSADSTQSAAPLVADVTKFTYQRFEAVSMPRLDVPLYAEFLGVPALEQVLRSRLSAMGYQLSAAPADGIARLQLAADYSAVGRYPDVGRVRTGNIDLGKVLATANPQFENKPRPGMDKRLLSMDGEWLQAMVPRISSVDGGSLAGGLGVQFVVAGLFDLTGLTSLIRRTHGPDSNRGPLQTVNIWINATSADGVQQSSRIEVQYKDPILAPTQIASAAFDYALEGIGIKVKP